VRLLISFTFGCLKKKKHVSSKTFVLPNVNTKMVLNDLLHLPKITKNLISAFKFAHDNKFYFEFHHNCYYVKH